MIGWGHEIRTTKTLNGQADHKGEPPEPMHRVYKEKVVCLTSDGAKMWILVGKARRLRIKDKERSGRQGGQGQGQ